MQRKLETRYLVSYNKRCAGKLAKIFPADYRLTVSLKEIKNGMAELPEDQQDHLAAYLVHLRHQRDTGLQREISFRLNDKNPDHWISIDQLREHWKD